MVEIFVVLICILIFTCLFMYLFILSQDCELLNIVGRPEKFMITTIPVPPLPIRPSVIMDGSQRSYENLHSTIYPSSCPY